MAVASTPCSAQSPLTYRESTGTREIIILIDEELLPTGSIIHSRMSDGEQHDVQIDSSAETLLYHVVSQLRGIDYTVTREGSRLIVDGVFEGKPVARSIRINTRPWYQSMEWSLHDYVRSESREPLLYWVVHPWEAKAYLLQARCEGIDAITLDGLPLSALRVRVGPAGILRIFWSTLYWFRPSDARYLRYEGVRGLPGTPKTTVELESDG
ncbi:MAG: hypothetical protein A2177_14095 [Spirochaetes bacterium RBG_13_68_11]|nr:MAG: hypothetical protein A2177_14095 [Spirochaetes bacterium RBG_13_68_11]